MRVLHVIPTLDRASGGPSAALVGLTNALRRAGVGVSVAVGRDTPDDRALIDRLRGDGVEVAVVEAEPGALARAVAACDVCHIHAVWEAVLHRAAAACRARGTPYLFRPCGMLDPWCLARGRIKKRLYIALRLRGDLDRAAAIHFMTRTERDLVRPLGFRAPAIVEGNGVDLAEFADRPGPEVFRAAWPAVGDRRILLFLGRIHPKKGLDLLVAALARLAPGSAVLVIAGPDEGGYRSRVEAMAAAAGVRDRVVFTGMLSGPDKLAALAAADLFVLPSYQENFGVAVVEALAAGTPVIVSDQVNVHPEISGAGVGGVVPTDAGALAAEIETWLTDHGRRATAAARSRPFVRDRYDWAEIAARWADRYAALAAGRPPEP